VPDNVVTRDDEAFSFEDVGEVQVVPWPLLLKHKVTERVEAHPKYPWIVLATALFGLFSVGFTITILSNSIPRIAHDLHSDESTLTWVVTAPLLAFAVFGPAAGKLADLRGQRRIYLYSLSGVCVFAGLTALAPNAAVLIACRAAGAAIGAAEGPASLAIINRTFSSSQRSQAMGWWSMVGAGAPVIGVVAGGPVVQAFGWRWIFVAQVPLTLATLMLAAAVLPEVPADRESRFDFPGAATLGVGALSLLLAINRGPKEGWTNALVIGGVALFVVMMMAFFAIERRVAHPLLPLAYLRRRNFTFPIATQFFTNFAYMGGFILTPLFLQNEFHYDETHTGALLISRPLAFAIAGPLAGYLTIRIGERTSAVAGAVAITGSMVALASLTPGSADIVVIASLASCGVGMGASSPAMAAAIANSVEPSDLGVAGATQQMVNQMGVVLGIQTLQAVQAAREGAVGGVAAFHDAYLLGAVAAGIGVAAALFVRRTTFAGEAHASVSSTP
jgi:EmrB/QacA subfamily drug resistance transporter